MLNWSNNLVHLLKRLRGNALLAPAANMIFSWVLLSALLLSGIVPEGYMRTAGADGMVIVICAPEGTSEVWLTDDGRWVSEEPANHSDSETSKCPAISLSLVALHTWLSTYVGDIEGTPFRSAFSDQRRALVTGVTPQQPRAPPFFS